jgi:DNA-binding NtrC family response regulator
MPLFLLIAAFNFNRDGSHTMRQHTILIVDDEEMILKSITRALRPEKYNVFTASSAEDGLKLLEAREVDLVVSDQHMPGMKGVEFLQKVKSDHPATITIMLTGHKDIDTAMQAINEAGVYKFILKPWDDEDFKITLRRALESLDLARERNALQESVKARDTILRNLEKEHPGITRVEKDEEGYLILE